MALNNQLNQLSVALILLVLAVPAQSAVEFEVCYDFGCRNSSAVALTEEEWQSVTQLFDAENPVEERKIIKKAVARMETLAGRYSPVHRDLGMNLPAVVSHETGKRDAPPKVQDSLFPGQLDCIDESLNTTRFLQLFEQAGLLKFH